MLCAVWLSEDGGPWEEITDGAYWDETQLSLFTDLLNTGCHYRIQADYDGGQTGILSFLYADEIVLEGYHDGDRDGGGHRRKSAPGHRPASR